MNFNRMHRINIYTHPYTYIIFNEYLWGVYKWFTHKSLLSRRRMERCTVLWPDLSTPSECKSSNPRRVIAPITPVLENWFSCGAQPHSRRIDQSTPLTIDPGHFPPAPCLPVAYSEKISAFLLVHFKTYMHVEGSLNQTLEEVVAFGGGGRRRPFHQHCARALSVRMKMFFVCAVHCNLQGHVWSGGSRNVVGGKETDFYLMVTLNCGGGEDSWESLEQ